MAPPIFGAMIDQVRTGISGFFRAFGFAMRNGLGWAILVPILLVILLYASLFAVAWQVAAAAGEWIGGIVKAPSDVIQPEGWAGIWDAISGFFSATGGFLAAFALKLVMLFVFALVIKYIVLIVLSPLLAYLSERAEEMITGRGTPFSLGQWLKDIVRGSFIALRNGSIEIAINLVVWVITLFVPLLAPLSAVFLFLVSAYFYGFSMFDYVFERRRMRAGDSVRAVNARLGQVVANGTLFSLLMKVPVLGICLAPAMGAIGAVLAMRERPGPEEDAR